MAGMEAAERHLNEALKRLEAALARRLAGGNDGGSRHGLEATGVERSAVARDVSVLRTECDRLSAALREAEEQNRSIRQVTETVARRLDGSISELDRLLEG